MTSNINKSDKRSHLRHNCNGRIEWSYLNKDGCFDGDLINFSESGIYFETDFELRPGATILLRVKKISTVDDNDQIRLHPRLISLGEVKWGTHSIKRDRTRYGVGVRYPFIT